MRNLYCKFIVHMQRRNYIDVSIQGYAAILLQRNSEDCIFHPIYYATKKTTNMERKFHSYELEILAIIKALQDSFRRLKIFFNKHII